MYDDMWYPLDEGWLTETCFSIDYIISEIKFVWKVYTDHLKIVYKQEATL
jgi:hypothetical protein